MTVMGSQTESKRLFVGNLFDSVTEDDLVERFSKFGAVTKVEVKTKKDIDGKVKDTFAFIDLGVSSVGLNKCITTLANTKWKGNVLKIQQARESFMERLARERKEKENGANNAPVGNQKVHSFDPMEEREAFKGFKAKEKPDTGYNPLSLLKSKVSGETTLAPGKDLKDQSNVGTASGGIVTFDKEESIPYVVSKPYYSSSDEEDEDEDDLHEKEANKATTSTNETSSSSSDSEDENSASQQTSTSVLQNLKSYNSFWKDSDDEDEMEKILDTKSSFDIQAKPIKEVKVEKRFKFEDASIFRYDPNDDDQEKYVKTAEEAKEELNKESKSKSFYEVREDLKSVFGKKSDMPTFSFGFRRDKEDLKISEPARPTETMEVDDIGSDDEFGETVPKQDSATNFGLQLKGKSSSSKFPRFFFTEDDSRLESGIAHFFNKKVHVDDLREKHIEQRPILSEILKKRARNMKAKTKGSSRSGQMKRKGVWKKFDNRKKFKRS